jgi:hypothetical protein
VASRRLLDRPLPIFSSPLDGARVTAVAFLRRYAEAMRHNLKRYYGAGDLHFITCSCYRRRPLLDTARRRDLFLTVLEQVRKRYEFVVVGYVVMPEHIHLLISRVPQTNAGAPLIRALCE